MTESTSNSDLDIKVNLILIFVYSLNIIIEEKLKNLEEKYLLNGTSKSRLQILLVPVHGVHL
jgi:hypothetical protein